MPHSAAPEILGLTQHEALATALARALASHTNAQLAVERGASTETLRPLLDATEQALDLATRLLHTLDVDADPEHAQCRSIQRIASTTPTG